MLQRAKFWELERQLKEKGGSIYDLCREANRFVTFMNSIEFTDDFTEKINLVRKAESSLNTIINICFAEMNPEINPIIKREDGISGNYNSLILYLQKLKISIGEARQNLTTSLKSKVDIETNVLVNNSNISFFISQLSGIYNDLIYYSMKRAVQIVIEIENPAVYFDDEEQNKIFVMVVPKNQGKALLDYMNYNYFLRTIQSTVPIFSNLKPDSTSIKYLPPEVREYQKMISQKQLHPKKEDGGTGEEDKGGEHGTEELDG